MFKKITRRRLDHFLAKHASAKRTLDIGSGGSGYHKFFPNRVSVDVDPERKPDIVADAHDLPFKDSEFEVVLCTEVLEHVKDPKKVISEIIRVLSSGGLVILTTRFVYPLHDTPHDYWRFTKYGMRELFRDMEIMELVPEAESFTALAILMQRLAFQSELWGGHASKFVLFLTAALANKMNWLIRKEYGSIRKNPEERDILSTGYYLVARKP